MNDRWIGLELRHFVALQAIADEGSFKGAARSLGYTPSAISQQIAGLERIVGARVIAREHGRRALGLTEVGRALLVHMTAIEARLEAAKADVEAFARGLAGPIRIGAFESVEARVLPEVLRRFRAMFPDVDIEVGETLLDLDLLKSVERGALDLAFGILPLPEGPFQRAIVIDDPWVLVAQARSEHAARPAPRTLGEVAERPLVCFRSPSAIAPALEGMRAIGIEPNIVLQSDYNDVVQEFAAAGVGVALMPRLAVNRNDDRTTIVDLSELIPPRQIVIAWHRDRTTHEAFDTLISLAVEVGSQVNREETRLESRAVRAAG
jgi:molybdate transport repressor ModE-like protein